MSTRSRTKIAFGYTLLALALLTLSTGIFLGISLSDLSISATLAELNHLHDQPVESNGFNAEALGLVLRNAAIYLALLVSTGVLAGVGGGLLRSASRDVPYEPVRHRTTSTIPATGASASANSSFQVPTVEPTPEPAPSVALSADVIATIAYGEPTQVPLSAPPLIPAPAPIPAPPAPAAAPASPVPLGAAWSNSPSLDIDEPVLDVPNAMRADDHVARTEATGVQSPTNDRTERSTPAPKPKARRKKYSKAGLAWLVVGSTTFVLGAITVGSVYLTGVAQIGQEQTLIAILVLVAACLGLQVLALTSLTNVFINRFRDEPVGSDD